MSTLPPMSVPMMTLSALAATAPDPRPSGESVAAQEARILSGINLQLRQLGSTWEASWLVLSPDRANLAYIAADSATPSFAVVLRGTQFDSLVDLGEDMDVGAMALFTAGGSPPVLISQGAMKAFTAIADSTSSDGDDLVEALRVRLAAVPKGTTPKLYVTGHSLGGCLATTIALYLAAQSWPTPPTFGVYTFAAPTAGLQAFADLFDRTFPSNSWRLYNAWDAVPYAWASLPTVIQGFYPSPGPAQLATVHQLLLQLANATKHNVYVQTNQKAGTVVLNDPSSYLRGLYDHDSICKTIGDFLAQVAYQHANDTYLALLGGMSVPVIVPSVTGIAPNAGSLQRGTVVILTGDNFASDSVVDFGPIPGTGVTVLSPEKIEVHSPDVVGTVDVRVTNAGGTSAAGPAVQFTAPEPTAPPTVIPVSPYLGQDPARAPAPSALLPNGGPLEGGTPVTVYGTGFVTDPLCVVRFGAELGLEVRVVSLTELKVYSPLKLAAGTYDVTVTNRLGTSQASPASRFTYGLPIVERVWPCCGPAKSAGKEITILGRGFTPTSSVTFGKEGSAKCTYKSSGELGVVPPSVIIPGGVDDVTVDVTVSNDGEKTSSPLTPNDVYTFYPS